MGQKGLIGKEKLPYSTNDILKGTYLKQVLVTESKPMLQQSISLELYCNFIMRKSMKIIHTHRPTQAIR